MAPARVTHADKSFSRHVSKPARLVERQVNQSKVVKSRAQGWLPAGNIQSWVQA